MRDLLDDFSLCRIVRRAEASFHGL